MTESTDQIVAEVREQVRSNTEEIRGLRERYHDKIAPAVHRFLVEESGSRLTAVERTINRAMGMAIILGTLAGFVGQFLARQAHP